MPTLRAAGSGVVVAQTRGTDFVEWCTQQQGKYEVGTIQKDGSVQTQEIQLEGKRGDSAVDIVVLVSVGANVDGVASVCAHSGRDVEHG